MGTFADAVHDAGSTHEDGSMHIDTDGDEVVLGMRLEQWLIEHNFLGVGINRHDPAGFLGAVSFDRGLAAATVVASWIVT